MLLIKIGWVSWVVSWIWVFISLSFYFATHQLDDFSSHYLYPSPNWGEMKQQEKIGKGSITKETSMTCELCVDRIPHFTLFSLP